MGGGSWDRITPTFLVMVSHLPLPTVCGFRVSYQPRASAIFASISVSNWTETTNSVTLVTKLLLDAGDYLSLLTLIRLEPSNYSRREKLHNPSSVSLDWGLP
ncbi:ras-specific guanine nucleotide-releasing factor RalGPS1-like [Platysternon megacephalum]|uniref:Ras-specific guanine nucleotide-releasing factor RalGPS1-like n=1 Tax=Platysternon megacephalum TaxID=55544 RepID=A0A4D9EBV1_9SAUR|nr:ras-specific guanine nucleotide-releasing factor RalGPS1-like [Platysternon megacephalum]